MNWPIVPLREGEGGGDGGEGGGGGSTTLLSDTAESGKTQTTATTDTKATKSSDATAEPFWDGWVRKDGTLDHGRLKHLPEDLADAKAMLERFKTVPEFVKSFTHNARYAREKATAPLREGADEQETTEHYKRIGKLNGAPENPEGYGIARPENVPEDMWSDDDAKAFAGIFHKYGAPPDMAKEMVALKTQQDMERLTSFEAQQAEENVKWVKEQDDILASEFGAFRDVRLQQARSGARWAGFDVDDPIFRDARVVVAFSKVGSKIEEAGMLTGQGGARGDAEPDPQDELNAMSHDPSHRFYKVLSDPANTKYKSALAYRRDLAKKIARREEVRGKS